MPIDRKISQEIKSLKILKMLAIMYEQIAVMKIKSSKSSVLNTRQFLNNVSRVFSIVKQCYLREPSGENIQKTINEKREVHVLLSSNHKLYGDILLRVFTLFLMKTKERDCDIVIIGEVGKSYYDVVPTKRAYTYFPNVNQIQPIIEYLSSYEHTFMYYGKYVNLLKQEPECCEISGDVQSEARSVEPVETENYLFEPNIPSVHSLFESHVSSALFHQKCHEFELARYSSRVQAMEKTHENITKQLSRLKRKTNALQALFHSKRQLQQIINVQYARKNQFANR